MASVPPSGASHPSFSQRATMTLIWVAPVVVLLAFAYQHYFAGLGQDEAADHAQLARHIARGDGQVTSLLRPVELGAIPTIQDHPQLYRPPLFAWLLALVFRIFGPSDGAAVATTAALFLCAVIITHRLGLAAFDRRTALLAAVLVALSPALLRASVEAVPAALGATLLALAIYLIFRHGRTRAGAPLAGAAAGLAVLADYYAIFALIPLALWVGSISPRRGRALVLFVGCAVVVVLPWLIRNTVVTHNPFYTSAVRDLGVGTSEQPGTTFLRTYPTAEHGPAITPRPLAGKVMRGWLALFSDAPALLGLAASALFLIALVWRFRGRAVRRMRAWVALALLLSCLLAPAGLPGQPFPLLFAPVVCVLAAAVFWALTAAWEDQPRRRTLAAAALIAFASGPVLIALILPRAERESPTLATVRRMARVLPRDAVVVTDVPWLVAWYADRTAVWLPVDPRNLRALESRFPVSHMFLSTRVGWAPREELMGNWRSYYMVLEGPPPPPWEVARFWQAYSQWHDVLLERSPP